MNMTNVLGMFPEVPADKNLAQEYFKAKYHTIEYLSESDSFLYRGIQFDYFKAAINFEENKAHSFMLVDKIDRYLWLFTYGEDEKMWNNFLIEKQDRQVRQVKPSWWTGIIDWILNRQPIQEVENPMI